MLIRLPLAARQEVHLGVNALTHSNKPVAKYQPTGYYYHVHLQSGGIVCGLNCDQVRASATILTDGANLEEALCPPGMTRKDRAGFASCLTDVTAMPGTYHCSFASEETDMETMMEGTVALVAQVRFYCQHNFNV